MIRPVHSFWLSVLLGAAPACAPLLHAAEDVPPPGAPQTEAPAARLPKKPATVELAPVELKLTVGERLVYDVRVEGIHAGAAQLVVRRKEPWMDVSSVWLVALEAHSNRAMSLYYRVSSMAKSSIDTRGGFSRKYWTEQKEGPLRSAEDIAFTYDVEDRKAVYRRERDGKLREHPPVQLSGKVLDPLAFVYYLRGIDYAKMEYAPFVLPVCTEGRVWNTRVTVTPDPEPRDFGAFKQRKILIVRPELEFRGLCERRGPVEIWLDAETRVPLNMTVETPVGSAEFTLRECENSPLNPPPEGAATVPGATSGLVVPPLLKNVR